MSRGFLSEKSAAIIKRWRQLVLETYPADGARFLKQEQDPFDNPVGATVGRSLETLYQELLEGMQAERLCAALDDILRIRAVQQFSPSQAVAFVFLLKDVVREELEKNPRDLEARDEARRLEARVDQLALLAFDVYTQCREKLFEIRVKELKAGRDAALRLLDRHHADRPEEP